MLMVTPCSCMAGAHLLTLACRQEIIAARQTAAQLDHGSAEALNRVARATDKTSIQLSLLFESVAPEPWPKRCRRCSFDSTEVYVHSVPSSPLSPETHVFPPGPGNSESSVTPQSKLMTVPFCGW